MAKAELGGHFKEAVLAWVDAAADPTKGIEQVKKSIRRCTYINTIVNVKNHEQDVVIVNISPSSIGIISPYTLSSRRTQC